MKKDSLYQQAKIARKNYRKAVACKNKLEIQKNQIRYKFEEMIQ